jgi:hypothetical protein
LVDTGSQRIRPTALIVGVMKGGTTTLYDRLIRHPNVARPQLKEPRFFSDDAIWCRGLRWYAENLRNETGLGLDASVDYTDPGRCTVAAARIADVLDSPPLVAIVRHPVARLRSHYLHEVLRGREDRAFVDAVSDPSNQYVGRSRYDACLAPYLRGRLRDCLIVLRTEELDDERSWARVLEHLGLDSIPFDVDRRSNESSGKVPMTRLGSRLWRAGLLQRAPSSPTSIRRAGRDLVFRDSRRVTRLKASLEEPLPVQASDELRGSTEAFWELVGSNGSWTESAETWR